MKSQFRREKNNKKNKSFIEGTVIRNAKGFGWLETESKKREGIFIPPSEMMYLMNGDKVKCKLVPNPKGPVAYIEKIISRAHESVVGTFYRKKRQELVEAQGQILAHPILISPKFQTDTKYIKDGTLVEVEIIKYPKKDHPAEGRVTQVLGKEGEFSSELEMILLKSKALREFSPEALAQAHTFCENPSEKEIQNRVDLTSLSFCTIDGETAKDFDDAVYGIYENDQIWVSVAIADVSSYVTPHSPIDKDAFARSTSIYYPGHCIPMIPEELSNGLCSLKPFVPRLSIVVHMLISKTGAIKKVRFEEAVINSKVRLTYNQVQKLIDNDFKAMREIPENVSSSIQALLKASRILRNARKKRGAIDFDAVESLVALDDNGEPVAIHPTERLEAHRLIEDLMIAANETVAEHLEKRGFPTIFRIHEKPQAEKLKLFINLAQSLGAISPADVLELQKGIVEPKPLSKIIEKFQNHPAKSALDTSMLRSMMQARYSAHNVGHFGLASKSYLHFTSPIRRYPDLMAHRILKKAMKQRKKTSEKEVTNLTEEIEEMALHCSDQERKAVDLERQISALHAVWLMQDKVGEEDEGTVTGCTEFGLFVRLSKYHVEGLVHVNALGNGYYKFDADRMQLLDERTGRSFKIGDKPNVRVLSVNVAKRFIDLELALGKQKPKEEDRDKKFKKRSRKKKR